MKLGHIFLNLSRIEEILFKNIGLGGSTYDRFMDDMLKEYDPKSNLSIFEYQDFCFEIFSEAYMKFFGKKYGIYDVIYDSTQSKVTFTGKDIKDNPSTILSLHIIKDRDITMNKDHLSSFTNISRTGYRVDVKSTNNMFIISNSNSVNQTIREKAPTFKNKVIFILGNEIRENVDNNPDFWYAFASSVFDYKVISQPTQYILRDFQIDGVDSMMTHSIGQILLPTGTGKSIIQADYIRRYITEINPCPVILILSPRIVLSYQLLNVVFNHLTNNNVESYYCNLSSGDMGKISEDMYKILKSKGLVPKKIEATTNINDIEKLYEKSKLNNFPLIISATYHSGWLLGTLNKDIDVVIFDESHNLVMGRIEEDFKNKSLELKSKKKFFFTATPCNTESDEGRGMNNTELFGMEIYRKSYREMVERNEILPIFIHIIDVENQLILKNKKIKDYSKENTINPDFDRDSTVKAKSIVESYHLHEIEIKKTSAHPESISPKLLVTCDSVPSLKGILKSKEIQSLREEGVNIHAISTEIKYEINGELYPFSNFKEEFMKNIKLLKPEDKAVILHVDMIGEGLDVTGITGVMAFSKLGTLRLIQLLGRAMRLHDIDRRNLYAGNFYNGMNREEKMVKPYAYVIIPMYLSDSNDLYELTRETLEKIHTAYDFMPNMIYNDTRIMGANESLINKEFKCFNQIYELLNYKQNIERNNFFRIMGTWRPKINL